MKKIILLFFVLLSAMFGATISTEASNPDLNFYQTEDLGEGVSQRYTIKSGATLTMLFRDDTNSDSVNSVMPLFVFNRPGWLVSNLGKDTLIYKQQDDEYRLHVNVFANPFEQTPRVWLHHQKSDNSYYFVYTLAGYTKSDPKLYFVTQLTNSEAVNPKRALAALNQNDKPARAPVMATKIQVKDDVVSISAFMSNNNNVSMTALAISASGSMTSIAGAELVAAFCIYAAPLAVPGVVAWAAWAYRDEIRETFAGIFRTCEYIAKTHQYARAAAATGALLLSESLRERTDQDVGVYVYDVFGDINAPITYRPDPQNNKPRWGRPLVVIGLLAEAILFADQVEDYFWVEDANGLSEDQLAAGREVLRRLESDSMSANWQMLQENLNYLVGVLSQFEPGQFSDWPEHIDTSNPDKYKEYLVYRLAKSLEDNPEIVEDILGASSGLLLSTILYDLCLDRYTPSSNESAALQQFMTGQNLDNLLLITQKLEALMQSNDHRYIPNYRDPFSNWMSNLSNQRDGAGVYALLKTACNTNQADISEVQQVLISHVFSRIIIAVASISEDQDHDHSLAISEISDLADLLKSLAGIINFSMFTTQDLIDHADNLSVIVPRSVRHDFSGVNRSLWALTQEMMRTVLLPAAHDEMSYESVTDWFANSTIAQQRREESLAWLADNPEFAMVFNQLYLRAKLALANEDWVLAKDLGTAITHILRDRSHDEPSAPEGLTSTYEIDELMLAAEDYAIDPYEVGVQDAKNMHVMIFQYLQNPNEMSGLIGNIIETSYPSIREYFLQSAGEDSEMIEALNQLPEFEQAHNLIWQQVYRILQDIKEKPDQQPTADQAEELGLLIMILNTLFGV